MTTLYVTPVVERVGDLLHFWFTDAVGGAGNPLGGFSRHDSADALPEWKPRNAWRSSLGLAHRTRHVLSARGDAIDTGQGNGCPDLFRPLWVGDGRCAPGSHGNECSHRQLYPRIGPAFSDHVRPEDDAARHSEPTGRLRGNTLENTVLPPT